MTGLRALHVIPALAPRYGGPSRVVFSMCRALRAMGVDAQVASTDADGPARLGDLGGADAPVPTRLFARQWSEAFKYSRPLARWLDGHVREFDVLHVHAVFSHACLAAARACRRSGVPYVVRPLGSLDPWSLARSRVRKRVLWHAGVARMLQGAAAIHYTTDEERRLAELSLGLGRGAVVPLGVDDELFDSPAAPGAFAHRHVGLAGRPYVLFLARLHPKKGLELLLEAFAGLADGDRADWRLVVAGDGDPAYVLALRQRAERLDRDGRTLFVGWLDGAERLAALRGAGLFVLPSHQENFGLAAAEAMAARVPVVLSDRVNLAALVTAAGAGWVVPPDAAALRKALAAALRDGSGRVARGRAGERVARERFSWGAVGAQLVELYQRIGGGRREGAA